MDDPTAPISPPRDLAGQQTGNRYLLVARIGPNSLHNGWLEPAGNRNFDVLLSAFDERASMPEGHGIFSEFRPGPKIAGLAEILRDHAELWRRYDHIAMFDDDLASDAKTISRMFELCREHRLQIAQPSLDPSSHTSFMGLLQQKGWQLRYTNFIEMMCPVFSREALEKVESLFGLGYESGIDLVWCNMLATGERDFAVLDEVAVRHTRPIGGQMDANGFVDGRTYETEIQQVLDRFSLQYVRLQPYAALDRHGRVVASRLQLAIAALPLLFSSLARAPRLRRGWNALVYFVRTLLFRPKRLPVG